MIKVRYNLSRGKNYGKWKIQSKSGVEYHSPNDVQLIMKNCTLKNNKKMAQRIFKGENKSVCAWISCESIIINIKEVTKYEEFEKGYQLRYNPKVEPFWRINNIKYNYDNTTFNRIASFEKELWIEKLNKIL